jgi:hypothetical protein
MRPLLLPGIVVLVFMTRVTGTHLFAPGLHDTPLRVPQRLTIYYGYPSLVNGSTGDVKKAVAVFGDYDVVVFGDGLEFRDVDPNRRPPGAGPTEHENTRQIISGLRAPGRQTAVYGYITIGNSQSLPLAEVQRRVDAWAAMGARGIFFDEAGYDFGTTRSRQNAVVDYVHKLGLSAFMNAYNPDDLFSPANVIANPVRGGNPDGLGCLLGSNDIFLLESFQIRQGDYEDAGNWYRRAALAVKYRERFGTQAFAVTTSSEATPLASEKFEYAWWSALLWGLDGFGWGEPSFSSQSNSLAWRPNPLHHPAEIGTRFVSGVVSEETRCRRRTDHGEIIVETTHHIAQFHPESSVGAAERSPNPRRR